MADPGATHGSPFDGSLEEACRRAEAAAADLRKATRQLERLASALQKAAAVGDTDRLRKATDALRAAVEDVSAAAEGARRAWPYDDAAVTGYLEGPYTGELLSAAEEAGVRMARLDDRLTAFPVVVQVQAGRRVVRVDGKPLKGIRPSSVVDGVRARQTRPTTRPEGFIEELHRAYRFAAHGERARRGVPVLDLYEILTIRAENRRSYSKAEFARDLFVLETSGILATRKGARMHLAASTSAKGSRRALVVPTPDGTPPRIYHTIRFEEPQP